LYGHQTINEKICPHARDWFHEFDEDIPNITAGAPKSSKHLEAAKKITELFFSAIQRGVHLSDEVRARAT